MFIVNNDDVIRLQTVSKLFNLRDLIKPCGETHQFLQPPISPGTHLMHGSYLYIMDSDVVNEDIASNQIHAKSSLLWRVMDQVLKSSSLNVKQRENAFLLQFQTLNTKLLTLRGLMIQHLQSHYPQFSASSIASDNAIRERFHQIRCQSLDLNRRQIENRENIQIILSLKQCMKQRYIWLRPSLLPKESTTYLVSSIIQSVINGLNRSEILVFGYLERTQRALEIIKGISHDVIMLIFQLAVLEECFDISCFLHSLD